MSEEFASSAEILIGEDDDGHAALIQNFLKDSGVPYPFKRFENGEKLWAYLKAIEINYSKSEKKCKFIILLDIRMPRMNGIELLKRVKEHSVFRPIPVIMLTTTDDPKDVEICYSLGCNFYMNKPLGFEELSLTLEGLCKFIKSVKIPPLHFSG